MRNIFDLLKLNWKAGLTVSLISLPLSLALAIASGASPTQGIITALWAGLIGAIFGGSNFNITGPTGALSGILIGYTIANGYWSLPIIAILSGIFIVIGYFFRIDKYIIFIPKSVVYGFTLGVAFIIGLNQIDNFLGISIPKTESLIEKIIFALTHITEVNLSIFLIFIFGVAFILLWNKKIHKIPGAVILAAMGIIFSILISHFGLGFNLETIGQRYSDVDAKIFINFWGEFSWNMIYDKQLWILSLATAIIAILETLMSGQIADSITKTKFNRKKEVLGVGLANIGSGIFGGIPATAALARTSLNIKSGATHKISAIISSLFLFIISFLLLPYFKWLPMVVIASILVFVAISMIEKKHFIHLLNNERHAFWLSIIVAAITILEDPIIGLLIGAIIALIIFVHNVSQGQTEILVWKNGKMIDAMLKKEYVKKEISSDMVVYKISGTLTYINMPAHLEAVEKIKNNKFVIISLRHAFYADADGIDYLEELIGILKKNNEKVILTGINPEIEKKIKNHEFYKKKIVEKKIYSRTSEAIRDLYRRDEL